MRLKTIKTLAAALLALSMMIICCAPVFAQTRSSEDYNEVQLAALVKFFQFEIVLEDEQTEMKNYEYAGLELDLNSPWTYPGVTWNDTVPYSVLSIDFSGYEKLSGKLDASSMNKIRTIDVSDTEIEWVVLGDNAELTDIDTSGAPVLSLDLTKALTVRNVDCSDCAIQQIFLPEHTLESLRCENNYLTFATLPDKSAAKEFTYAPQKDAFFIVTGDIGAIQIGQKADMSSYGADSITWYNSEGELLTGAAITKEQIYEFEGVQPGDQIYAVMTNADYPELTLKTGSITVTGKTYLALMFWSAVLFFFVLFFGVRFMVAKRKGDELRTDPITDKLEEWWDQLIKKISDQLPKGKKGEK